jgi:hypothetical protein
MAWKWFYRVQKVRFSSRNSLSDLSKDDISWIKLHWAISYTVEKIDIFTCHIWNMREVLVSWWEKWNFFIADSHVLGPFMAKKHDLSGKKISVCHAPVPLPLNAKFVPLLQPSPLNLESWNFGSLSHLGQLDVLHIQIFEIQVPKGSHLREVFPVCYLGHKDLFSWPGYGFNVFRK